MRGAQRLELMDVGLELHALQDVRVASDQGLGLGGGEHDFVDVCRRIGAGGLCPSCDEPIALADLLPDCTNLEVNIPH